MVTNNDYLCSHFLKKKKMFFAEIGYCDSQIAFFFFLKLRHSYCRQEKSLEIVYFRKYHKTSLPSLCFSNLLEKEDGMIWEQNARKLKYISRFHQFAWFIKLKNNQ